MNWLGLNDGKVQEIAISSKDYSRHFRKAFAKLNKEESDFKE